MKFQKVIRILHISLIGISVCNCKTEEIILHGEINGNVTDIETGKPLPDAKIKLIASDDSITTDNDGKYIFKNLIPGPYEIKASKEKYNIEEDNIYVTSANTLSKNFALSKIPITKTSDSWLDFGLDNDTVSFTIANAGSGKLIYALTTSQSWISVFPSSGEVTHETDTIKVAINRTGLSIHNKYKENVKILAFSSQGLLSESFVDVYVNGILDTVLNYYYRIVKIGTQVWMGENINTGTYLNFLKEKQINNGIIEKYCFGSIGQRACPSYGGLYLWDEVMQYKPPDNNITGTTQGVCPVGWHIPTKPEWEIMFDFLGGPGVAGGKLKSIAIWEGPDAIPGTNLYGFRAIPSESDIYGVNIRNINMAHAFFWTASECSAIPPRWCRYCIELRATDNDARINYVPDDYTSDYAYSVRCIRDKPANK